MIKLFDAIEDLVSIERSTRDLEDDNGEYLWGQDVYFLHLDSNRFLIVDAEDLEIIGHGKDHWFYRECDYRTDSFNLFTYSEILKYEELLRLNK